ncbi:WXG100 family type VII secretion target [Actinomadura physcomitrii]|nr:WXG100 family type VII secretion target [Actinomadura physcomitrii]
MTAPRPRPRPGRRGGGSTGDSRPGASGTGNDAEEPQGGPTAATMLIDIAASVMLATEVAKAYRTLQKMKPNPNAVRAAARKWYEASAAYHSSFDPLKITSIELGGYWKGPAYEAFDKYMEKIVLDAATNISDTLTAIGDTLIDLHNQIVDQYNDGMRSYQETLTKAIDYHLDLKTMEGDARDSAWGALHSLLKMWIDGIYVKKQAIYGITQRGASAMESLNGKILQLDPPAKAPAIVADKGRWTYG